MMKSPIFTLFILLGALGSMRGNSEVMESRSNYSCCETPKIEFNQQYETSWIINGKSFAYSKGVSNQCIPPCKEIEGGWITLDECTAVNATVVSTNEMKLTVEKRISYYGQPCSGSPGNHGSIGMLLLAVVIAGLIVK